jgi:hypothetical protein
MSKLVKKDGKFLKKDGKFVKTDNIAECSCCGDGPCPPGKYCTWIPPDPCSTGKCQPDRIDDNPFLESQCGDAPYDCRSEQACNQWYEQHPNPLCDCWYCEKGTPVNKPAYTQDCVNNGGTPNKEDLEEGCCSQQCSVPPDVCGDSPSVLVNCSNFDCSENDFSGCLDGIKDAQQEQGYEFAHEDTSDCCQCDGSTMRTVVGCCPGGIDFDPAKSITIPRKDDGDCVWCSSIGEGCIADEEDGKPVWRIYQCKPEPPPPCGDCVPIPGITSLKLEVKDEQVCVLATAQWTPPEGCYESDQEARDKVSIEFEFLDKDRQVVQRIGGPANIGDNTVGYCNSVADACDPFSKKAEFVRAKAASQECESKWSPEKGLSAGSPNWEQVCEPPPPCPPGKFCSWTPPDPCSTGKCFSFVSDDPIECPDGFPYDCTSEQACNQWYAAHPNPPCDCWVCVDGEWVNQKDYAAECSEKGGYPGSAPPEGVECKPPQPDGYICQGPFSQIWECAPCNECAGQPEVYATMEECQAACKPPPPDPCPPNATCTWSPPDCGDGECWLDAVWDDSDPLPPAYCAPRPYDCTSKAACEAWLQANPNPPCVGRQGDNPLP